MEWLESTSPEFATSSADRAVQRIRGAGRMAALIRSHDWQGTELGAIDAWPKELVVLVNQLLASKLMGCIVWGEQKRLIYNDLYEPLLGNKPIALGKPFLEVWEEIREQAAAIIAGPLESGESNLFEEVPFQILIHGEFVEKICSLTNDPIWVEREDGPQIAGIYQTIIDHTDGQKAIRQLTAMYDSGAVAAALIDPKDFRYLRVNKKLAAMLDTTTEELTGSSVFELAGKLPLLRQQLEKVAAGEPLMEVTSEGELANRPGERRVWQSNYVPVFSSSGEVTGISAASIEVTAQKKAEAILIRNEKLAAVGRLAASIAHEINNPLESVMNLVYLARGSEDMATVDGYLEVAERELSRASAITSQTLRFYKQSTSALGVTAHELFESVLAIQQGRLVNSGVQLERRERAAEPVRCFDGEIRQVLNNIIGNALDAMQGQGGRLFVRSRTGTNWSTGARGVVITVADTGVGISHDVKARLFEAFYTTKGINGNGLGLWITKEIVDRHNGALKVRSTVKTEARPGVSGTVFTLFLPFDAVAR